MNRVIAWADNAIGWLIRTAMRAGTSRVRTSTLLVGLSLVTLLPYIYASFHSPRDTQARLVGAAFTIGLIVLWCVLARIYQSLRSVQRSLEDQLLQAQKVEAIGSLAGGIAHDFNNVLTAIIGYADLISASGKPEQNIDEIRAAGLRAAALVRQLMAFGRKRPPELVVLDIVERVRAMVNMLAPVIGPRIRIVVNEISGKCFIRADMIQIDQVIVNLMVNARDAMPAGGVLTIETGSHSGAVYLIVSDTGIGMDEATLEKAFEPFFTTKGEGKGTGLGLAIVRGIVERSGGNIDMTSTPGSGTTARLFFPEAVRTELPDSIISVIAERGHERILVVEDDETVRRLLIAALENFGYQLTATQSGDEALDIESGIGEIDLMVTDMMMPGIDVRELVLRMKTLRPKMKVLLISGSDEMMIPGVAFLIKPWTMVTLSKKVREVLDSE